MWDQATLDALIRDLFTNDELYRLLAHRTDDLVDDLPSEDLPPAAFAFKAAALLERRGLVHEALRWFREEVPGRRADIDAYEDGLGRAPTAMTARGWLLDETRERERGRRPVIVGAKHIVESNFLCALLAMLITDRAEGYVGVAEYDRGSHLATYHALLTGHIDLYVDYSGTIYELYLQMEREQIHELQSGERRNRDISNVCSSLIAHGLPMRAVNGARLEAPLALGFTNNWQLLLSKSFVQEHQDQLVMENGGVSLRSLCGSSVFANVRVCAHEAFRRRSDGLGALEAYAGVRVRSFEAAGPGHRYCRLLDGDVDLVDGYETDPQCRLLIEAGEAVRVHDTLDFWPQYNAVVLTRASFLAAHPQVGATLGWIENRVTPERLQPVLGRLTLGGNADLSELRDRCSDQGYPVDLANLDVPREQEVLLLEARAFLDGLD